METRTFITPLYSFTVPASLDDFQVFDIIEKDGQIVLFCRGAESYTPIDIPVPFDHDVYSEVFDSFDNLHLEFKDAGCADTLSFVVVKISAQNGYWYYGSIDDSLPEECSETQVWRMGMKNNALFAEKI